MLRVVRHTDAKAFLDRAGAWLLASETTNGLLLGVAQQVLAGTTQYRQPLYWATIEDDSVTGLGADASGAIVGCAFRTPPHQVGVTDLPLEAIPALVSSLRETYLSLPGVGGPEVTAAALATTWTERFGGTWSVLTRQRLHTLTEVQFPRERAPGTLRLALEADVPVARAWIASFIKDTGVRHVTTDAGERLIRDRRLHFWVDGEPRCMLSAVRDTPNTTGIAAVYTPARFRNRGYATMAVATLSQQLLDQGRRSCFLYTDLANPVSNAVYRRVGYEPVQDVVDIMIL
jgi:GNAT superfamily N-acetyltransferase